MKTGSPSPTIETLLEDAYRLAEKYSLFGVHKRVPKNSDPDFKNEDHNFSKYVRYSIGERDYTEWLEQTQQAFDELGLQKSKFTIKINDYNPTTESNLPAHKFLRAINELEKLRDSSYLLSYQSTQSIPKATFARKTLVQGQNSHPFRDKYAGLIKELWAGRKIVNSRGDVIQTPQPLTRGMISSRLGIDHEELINIAKGIRKAGKDNSIDIKISYPRNTNDVFLIVIQDVK